MQYIVRSIKEEKDGTRKVKLIGKFGWYKTTDSSIILNSIVGLDECNKVIRAKVREY